MSLGHDTVQAVLAWAQESLPPVGALTRDNAALVDHQVGLNPRIGDYSVAVLEPNVVGLARSSPRGCAPS